MVRGRTPLDGRWTLTDRLLAAAYRRHLEGICKGCGGYLDETTDSSRFSGPRRTHEHVHDKPTKCWTCDARATEAERLRKNEKHPHLLRFLTRVVQIGQRG